jgi:hypothetical protein
MDIAFWRDVSVVWLSFLCFIGLLIPLAALYFLVRGLNAAHTRLAPLLRRAQGYSRAMHNQSESLSHKVAEPVIQANRQLTKVQTLLQNLGRVSSKQRERGHEL